MLFLTILLCFFVNILETTSTGSYEFAPEDYLRWHFSHMNKNCTSASGERSPCTDIRVCSSAVASLAMGGWPALCGWVGKGVPRVCCGLPLVLGPALMKKVDEEKARNRRCGTRTWQDDISETERRFFQIRKTIPPVDTRDPSKFDPPLDLRREPMVSPIRREVLTEDFPWVVSIKILGSHLCAGSLIDRKHILSSAHCFVTERMKVDENDYMVYIGNIDIDKGYGFRVRKITLHPEYMPDSLYNDLAILTLNEEILKPQFAHICLPSLQLPNTDLTGKDTTLLGWGYKTFAGKPVTRLNIVDNLPVISQSKCEKIYEHHGGKRLRFGLTEDFICAGKTEGSAEECEIEPGGPLMYTDNSMGLSDYQSDIPWVLVGINSFGFRCGEPGYPGVYTRVASHMDWIINEMNEPF